MWPLAVWMLLLSLSLGHTVERGCQDWIPSSEGTDVCCRSCKPGNRLVTECGPQPETLCEVCENRTYVTVGTQKMCHKCRECRGMMRVKQPCTAHSDTVCECTEGYLCGDDQCSYCIQQCGVGEQPTENRGCQACPKGTFNNQVNQPCMKWSSRCPSPDQKIIANGTAVSDIKCAPADDYKPIMTNPDVKPTKIPTDSEDNSPLTALIIAIACAFLIVAVAVPLFIAVTCKMGATQKTAPWTEEAPAAGQRLMPELEQCSFCFPQEERGSSSEVSLVSDDKPFELVV